MTRFGKSLMILGVVTCAGCMSTGSALRDEARRGAPLVTRSVDAPRDPGRHLLVANPAKCLIGADWPGVIISLGCLCVVVPLDLIALPFTASARFQDREVLRLQGSCGVQDPGLLVADGLAERMTQEYGFSPPGDAPEGAVVLEMRTITFRVSPRAAWKGTVELSAEGKGGVLWRDTCFAEAPAREAGTPESECEAAQAEIPALVNQCVESFARHFAEAWGRTEAVVPSHLEPATTTECALGGR